MAALMTQPVESVGQFFSQSTGRFGIGVICQEIGGRRIREFFTAKLVAVSGIRRLVSAGTPACLIVYVKNDHLDIMNPAIREVQRELVNEHYKFKSRPKKEEEGKIWQFEFES